MPTQIINYPGGEAQNRLDDYENAKDAFSTNFLQRSKEIAGFQ